MSFYYYEAYFQKKSINVYLHQKVNKEGYVIGDPIVGYYTNLDIGQKWNDLYIFLRLLCGIL